MTTELKMTNDERLVWSALSGCRGKAMAVTQYELAQACTMTPRHVRQVIEQLIYKHRKPVGSTPAKKAGGYFVIDNEDEAKETADRYRRQAVKILQRAGVVLQISEREVFEQLQMQMEGL